MKSGAMEVCCNNEAFFFNKTDRDLLRVLNVLAIKIHRNYFGPAVLEARRAVTVTSSCLEAVSGHPP